MKGKEEKERCTHLNEEFQRKAKGKGEKERYTHLNADLQRIARRDKKAFLSNQYKEIEKQQNGKD